MTDNAIQSVDKALVAKRFAHARNTYSREARVQQQVAEKMLRLLMEHTGAATAVHNSTDPAQSRLRNTHPFRHIAEFGCRHGMLFPLAAPYPATGNSAAQRPVSRNGRMYKGYFQSEQ